MQTQTEAQTNGPKMTWYERNKEKARATKKAYYERNKERLKAKRMEYYYKYREGVLAKQKVVRATTEKEYRREQNKKYHQSDKGKASMRRYKDSEKGKAARKRYQMTHKHIRQFRIVLKCANGRWKWYATCDKLKGWSQESDRDYKTAKFAYMGAKYELVY